MAERIPEIRAQSQAANKTLLKKHTTLEVLNVDDADTIPVNIMTNIDTASAVDLATGSAVTVDIAGNELTVNDAGVSNDHLIILVVGS